MQFLQHFAGASLSVAQVPAKAEPGSIAWVIREGPTEEFPMAKQEQQTQEMAGSHERRETHDLIGSDKVEGTAVYRSNGEKVGKIERIMLEKVSGKVAYAVMSFGGVLGLGHDHYPVP